MILESVADIGVTQNNENGAWLLSGKWSNTVASIFGHYESIFSVSFNMANTNENGCITIRSQEE
jgi:hypothetical protein